MCYAGQSLKDAVRDTEARVVPAVRAWNEERQDVVLTEGLRARVLTTLAGWMRRDVRA